MLPHRQASQELRYLCQSLLERCSECDVEKKRLAVMRSRWSGGRTESQTPSLDPVPIHEALSAVGM
jgi:hypothetical protein